MVKMARSRYDIMSDIIRVLYTNTTNVTTVMIDGKLSYGQIQYYLTSMLDYGLLELVAFNEPDKHSYRKGTRFMVTECGRNFHRCYLDMVSCLKTENKEQNLDV